MIGVSIAVGFVAYFTFFLVDVPAGHIGVKEVLGPPLDPAQRFLPARREILPAGRHVINPFLYEVEVVECVEVPHGHIGVIKDKDGKLRPLRPGQYNLPADEVKIIDLSKYKFFIMEDGIQVQPAHEAPPGTPAEIEEGFDFDFTWEPPDFTPEQVDKLKLNVSEYPSWSIK
jgi:hypothetical protein